MICLLLVVKGSLGAGKPVEAVFHFFLTGSFRRIENPFAIVDLHSVGELEVLGHDAQKEGHGTGSVGKGVEDIQVDTLAAAREFEHVASVLSDVERF